MPKQTRAPPRGYVVVALALAGIIAAVGSYKLSLAGEYGSLPHVHAALVSWIVVAYVGCGLVAWTRRPESRFGPLLVAAGLVPALSRLAEADSAALRTFGEGLLLLPADSFSCSVRCSVPHLPIPSMTSWSATPAGVGA